MINVIDIEELVELFSDERIKLLLAKSYWKSQGKNKKLSDDIFEQLFNLKILYPNIDMLYDSTIERSFFSPVEGKIYMKETSSYVFLHELTHLLSYYKDKFQLPEEYQKFKATFLSNPNNHSDVISLLKTCKEKKERILSEQLDLDNNKNIDKEDSSNQDDEIRIITCIEDIIDAIYDGTSYDMGLRHVKDDKSLMEKAPKTPGHGCDYYQKKGYQFEEILANYQAINALDPNNQMFSMLKTIIGPEFTRFLDRRCQKINQPSKNIEINNNKIR